MTAVSLCGFALAMLVLAASPGPGVLAVVSRSLASGFIPALGVIIGIIAGDIICLLCACFGLALAVPLLGESFVVLKLAAGGYLVWLGLKMWLAGPATERAHAEDRRPSSRGNFLHGLLITLCNPKAIVFYGSFLPTSLDLRALEIGDLLIVATVVSLTLLTVMSVYALLAGSARRFLNGGSTLKAMNRTAGGVMTAAGVSLAAGA
jgi:threonine/homoserine/homoserine lactone efflux protein